MNREQMDESKRLCDGKLPVVALTVEDINDLPIGTVMWDSVEHREVVSGESRLHPEETDGVTRYGLILEVKQIAEGSPGYHPQQAQMEGREPTREETAAVLKDYFETLIDTVIEDEADTQVSDSPAADVADVLRYLAGLTDVCPGCGVVHSDPDKADLN